MWFRLSTVGVVCLFLAGCDVEVPIVAVSKQTGEKLVGTAFSGSGKIVLFNHNGLQCGGSFNSSVVASMDSGFSRQGTIECPDGRRGSFTVAGTARGGQGVGNLGGKPFDVYYGRFAVAEKL